MRLTGGYQTSDTVGLIVWAKNPDAEGVWWPAEALDPFFMPFTHELPPAAVMSKYHFCLIINCNSLTGIFLEVWW